MSAERFSSQYWRGESPGTLRSDVIESCWVFLHRDKVGAERRQSNDRTLIKSFIVVYCENQSVDYVFNTSHRSCD